VAVGFDAATEFPTTQSAGASNTLTLSWNHIPVTSTPKGVGVFVTYAPSSLTYVTSVKYGDVALSKIASARDTATEPGVMEFWYLGTGVPTGTQAFNVLRLANTAGMWGAGFTVSASADTVVSQFLTVEENTSLNEKTLSTVGIGTRFAGAYYGGAAPPGVGANSTTVFDIDYGAYAARVVRETTAGSGNRVVGFAAGTGDDVAAIYVAIEELIAKTTISAIGVASNLTFGTAALTNRFNLLASSKASDAAFGQTSLTFNRILLPPSKAADTAFGTLTVLQDIEYSLSASVPPGYKYTVLNNPELSANWSIGSSYGSTLSTSDIVVFKKFAFRDGTTATHSVTISTNGRVIVNSGADSSSYTIQYFIWDEETSLYGTTANFSVVQSLVQNQTISAIGKASDLAFGTVVLQSRTTVLPTGKVTDAAFGTVSLSTRVTVFPNGKATDAAFGTTSVLAKYTVLTTGLASNAAFGTPTLTVGDVTISVVGKASDLAFGTFSIAGDESTASFSVSATVPPGYKFTVLSSPEISNTYNIGYSLSPTLATGDIVVYSEWATQNGTTTSYSVTINTAGFPTVDAISTSGSLSFKYFIWDDSAQSYGSTGTYSMLEFFADQIVYPNDLSSSAAFGTPSIIADQFISPNGLASQAAFGTVSINAGLFIYPGSKDSDAAFGQVNFKSAINPIGLESSATFGTVSLKSRLVLLPNGLASDLTFGTFQFGTISYISPNSYVQVEAFGQPTFGTIYILNANSLASGFATGVLTLTFDQYIELIGKAYTEFGQFRIYIAGQLVVAGDNIFEWFQEQPGVQGSKLDRLKEYLNSQGYKGSSNSMVFRFLRDQGYKGSLPQMISRFERDFTNRYGPA